MLLRDDPEGGVQVYLIQRHHRSGFLGGAFAFPGGKVDEADRSSEDPSRAGAVRETEEEVGVTLKADDLIHVARWITPEAEPRRFDADFYVARLPDGQEAKPSDRESLQGAWSRPEAALEAMRARDIFMAPPPLRSLEVLADAPDVAGALARARREDSPVIRPKMKMDSGRLQILLPGDPEHDEPHPALPGATRFTLVDGVWE